jgi:hypothetical protein
VACANILGFERLELADAGPDSPRPQSDAALDTFVPPTPCEMLNLPAEPPTVEIASDAGDAGDAAADGGASRSYVLAISDLDVGVAGAAGVAAVPVGLNLDKLCTTSRATSSCVLPANLDDGAFLDFVNDKNSSGLDNSGFSVLRALGDTYGSLSAQNIRGNLKAGRFGVVLLIEDYNGTGEDTQLKVAIQPALGVEPTPGKTTPQFTSADIWRRDRRYSVPFRADLPGNVARRAYVNGGWLVAPFSELALAVHVEGSARKLDIEMTESYLVGKLRISAGGAYIDEGYIAGRWPISKALGGAGELRASIGNAPPQPVCNLPLLYEGTVKPQLCKARDLAESSGAAVSSRCNSISAGFRIQAVPASPTTFVGDPLNPPEAIPPNACDASRCELPDGGAP